MSQYSASTLDVTANYNGENFPCEITNVSWNGTSFNGNIDGINVNGVDNNGNIIASGSYFGHKYTASGVVTGWN